MPSLIPRPRLDGGGGDDTRPEHEQAQHHHVYRGNPVHGTCSRQRGAMLAGGFPESRSLAVSQRSVLSVAAALQKLITSAVRRIASRPALRM